MSETKALLISKYKPTTIKEFFGVACRQGQQRVLQVLAEIDDLNILFIGNACSGKTTLLNIMIREYYKLDVTEPVPENNILYINNLKEQGISFFRGEMKTFCQASSTVFGKKKMVIIDDIDMVGEQSQQVFRNYIDKYFFLQRSNPIVHHDRFVFHNGQFCRVLKCQVVWIAKTCS